MWGFTKTVIKIGLVGLVVGGAAMAILGRHRVERAVHAVKDGVCSSVDSFSTQFTNEERRLRGEMEQLRDEYPQRIAELKAMKDEIGLQLLQATEEAENWEVCVELIAADLKGLQPQLENAAPASFEPVIFRGARYSQQEAIRKSQQLMDLKEEYTRKLESNQDMVDMLRAEADATNAEFVRTQKDYHDFINKYQTLQREIDRRKMTDKVLDLAEKRKQLYSMDKSGRMANLDSIEKRLGQWRDEQREKMKAYNIGTVSEDYETRARFQRTQQDEPEIFEFSPMDR